MVISRESRAGPVVRLPKIPLSTFDCDICEWLLFRDRFLSMVDERIRLSDIDNIYYLTSSLKGVGLDVVRGIPIACHTYKLVWSTLEARLVAYSVVETLLKTLMSSTETLSDLKSSYRLSMIHFKVAADPKSRVL